ncbi:MAG: CHAD domain-containing protein [Bryobacterales bacterium]|nr:CHAD domain-containing protein [Bryobacterales bacterium]
MRAPSLWLPDESVAANARSGLPLLAARFFVSGGEAAEAGGGARQLHRFRITAKRFRYTLEIFRGIYGPRLQVLINEVRQVQDLLGARNDCSVALAMIHGMGCERLRTCLEKRGQRHERDFRRFWNEHFSRPEIRRRWIHYLAAYPGRKRGQEDCKATGGAP